MATNTPRHVATGIAGLDMVLGGGVLRRRLYVIEGPPGAGKTTLALHFLLAGRDNHERGLWLTTTLGEHSRKIPGWPLDCVRTHVTFSFLHLGSCTGFSTDFQSFIRVSGAFRGPCQK
jgi:replicative DNA helicase